MFQVAATIATSLKYKIPYCIPKHTLNDKVWKPYYFENVNYCDDIELVSTAQVWKEPSHAYHEIPMPNHRRFILDGYMQSEKYFKDYLPEIRKAFGFDNLVTKKGICSIHVRRGDYLRYPDKHPIITMKYILEAISVMFDKKGCKSFLMFSDDIEWCKRNLKSEFISYSEGKNEIEDMKLMASCEHNIIANSTYSLMASILNNNPDKICIAPKVWFGEGNAHLDTKDICPESYIRL